MFIPIGTDRRQQHTPWVNYTIIAVNALVFLIQEYYKRRVGDRLYEPMTDAEYERLLPYVRFMFNPEDPHLYQFVTSVFMHADWMHLLGNMVFLYVFGNALEDRLGKVAYASYYLAAGIMACLAHGLTYDGRALGASGAIAGVSGAFAVLFPNSRVKIIYFFFLIGAFEVSAIVLILFYIAMDAFFYLAGGGNVAYTAHLGGYAMGFCSMFALLYTRILPQDEWDLLALLKHRKRRRDFKKMTNKGYRPWELDRSQNAAPGKVQGQANEQEQKLMTLRSKIASAVSSHRMDEATDLYAGLLNVDPSQTMSQQHQLDLANHFMTLQDHAMAAQAYELFLKAYRTYNQRGQIELMLGVVYARYLANAARARELLESARDRLADGPQKEMAEKMLGELG